MRVVNAVEALAGHPNFSKTAIEDFRTKWDDYMKTDAQKLDKTLRESDAKQPDTNYVNKPWTQMYLADRRPLPFNYNPGVAICDVTGPNDRPNQLVRAAQVIWATTKYHLTMKDGYMEPELANFGGPPTSKMNLLSRALPNIRISKGKIKNQSLKYLPYAQNNAFPLDMAQYPDLLFTTRIPQKGLDRIYHTNCPSNRHVPKGRFYKIDAITPSGFPRDELEIYADLKEILAHGENLENDEASIAAFTSAERDSWAEIREEILENDNNKKAMEMIDNSMFVLALDSRAYQSADELLREGIGGPAINRYYDKSLTIVIGECGMPVINFEHAWGDGAAVLSFMTKMNAYVKDSLKNGDCILTNDNCSSVKNSGNLELLSFELDEKIKTKAREIAKEHDAKNSRLESKHLLLGNAPLTNVGQYWKEGDFQSGEDQGLQRYQPRLDEKVKIGADGFLQLALQLAGRKYYGHPVSAYESASTSMFKMGRTECIRPATKEAQACCEEYLRENIDNQKFAELIRAAIKRHNQQTKDCLGGNGWDRHIFGLRVQHGEQQVPMHEVFGTEVFAGLYDFPISTSTLNSDNISTGGFGPVTQNGFGIGYIIRKDWIAVTLSGFKVKKKLGNRKNGQNKDQGADVQEFAKLVEEAFLTMKTAIDSTMES
ncbi:Oidioi.mRNA.OKI2018_I69.chr2.g4923.t1.cds [Oikopleura dioica]|uniref:Oidioi.mRNA.OKI2018_I69.chr2.g4923.t1.cds n=1 Tax=Oikopleura dioica TaxID=34765 RepID=A0ABN7SYK1_OIKDI|nr:Oidioi.mRNA.OKI2018_I69.chr2.g4923.t1.cds [Oikopleura dioica]